VPESWKRFEEALLEDNRDWQVWTDWYRARLDGGATDEALEVARVSIAAEVWDQGPRAVHPGIARLIAEHGKGAWIARRMGPGGAWSAGVPPACGTDPCRRSAGYFTGKISRKVRRSCICVDNNQVIPCRMTSIFHAQARQGNGS
jgi:hypothetical protein